MAGKDLSRDDITRAYKRIAGRVKRTPVFTSRLLNETVGADLFFKCEHLQAAGAFKFRGATHAISLLTDEERSRGVVTHSSGNHAQALALAAQREGVMATIVMPRGSNPLKRAATEAYGARVVECDNNQTAREATCAREQETTGAALIHPYDDSRIIAGAGTAALELLEDYPDLDTIVTPVGGGGLLSGTALAASLSDTVVYGAEPSGADDAHRGFSTGVRVTEQVPDTVADGLRTLVGVLNFRIIQEHVAGIGVATDAEIWDAMGLIHSRLKQLVEPSSAVPLACLMNGSIPSGRRVGIILSGGNVDVAQLAGRSTP